MLQQMTRFFLHTTSGKLVGAVLVTLIVGYGLRVYFFDMPKLEKKAAAQVGVETLEEMGDALDEAYSAKGDALLSELPEVTGWYPQSIMCGRRIELPTTRDAIWETLKTPKDGGTEFQYRFESEDGAFKLLARRDSDCDGTYAVWLLQGSVSSVLGRQLTAQNIQE